VFGRIVIVLLVLCRLFRGVALDGCDCRRNSLQVDVLLVVDGVDEAHRLGALNYEVKDLLGSVVGHTHVAKDIDRDVSAGNGRPVVLPQEFADYSRTE